MSAKHQQRTRIVATLPSSSGQSKVSGVIVLNSVHLSVCLSVYDLLEIGKP